MNRLKISLVATLLLLTCSTAVANEGWIGPISGKLIVVRSFDGIAYQANHYGKGHRGVDLLAEVGDRVFAPTTAIVAFVGVINGTPIITLAHTGSDRGVLTTYLPVESKLKVGEVVMRSALIGYIGAQPHLFASGKTVLHWGERIKGEYKNPLRRLGAPILLPRLS